MIRILHTADLHLDSPLKSLALRNELLREKVQAASRAALERMVRFCADEDVRALLIAGDLFDGSIRSARTAAYLAGQMERLREADVSVFYVKGNHDAESPVSGAIDFPANVHVFDGRGGKAQLPGTDVWIHGVSYRRAHAPESLLPKYPDPVPGAVNIALMHTSLTGASGHDPYAPCGLEELRSAGFQYWALGHVHRRAEHARSPWIVMPGMPQGRDIGEAGQKSATLLKISGSGIEVEEVPTSIVEFRESRCLVDGVESDEDLRRKLRTHLRAEADKTVSDTAILRLALTGRTARAWQVRRDRDVWLETASELAEETGGLWVEALKIETEPPADRPNGGAVEELCDVMEVLQAEPGFLEFARAEVDQALSLLPARRRSALAPDEPARDSLVESLAGEALQSMAARMRGAGQ